MLPKIYSSTYIIYYLNFITHLRFHYLSFLRQEGCAIFVFQFLFIVQLSVRSALKCVRLFWIAASPPSSHRISSHYARARAPFLCTLSCSRVLSPFLILQSLFSFAFLQSLPFSSAVLATRSVRYHNEHIADNSSMCNLFPPLVIL